MAGEEEGRASWSLRGEMNGSCLGILKVGKKGVCYRWGCQACYIYGRGVGDAEEVIGREFHGEGAVGVRHEE